MRLNTYLIKFTETLKKLSILKTVCEIRYQAREVKSRTATYKIECSFEEISKCRWESLYRIKFIIKFQFWVNLKRNSTLRSFYIVSSFFYYYSERHITKTSSSFIISVMKNCLSYLNSLFVIFYVFIYYFCHYYWNSKNPTSSI